jgi:hypothetical protein
MTVWATSSPFSPLSKHANTEPAHEPAPLLQTVQNLFAVSDSVLPPSVVRPAVLKIDNQSQSSRSEETEDVSERTDANEHSNLEETYALRQQDRAAWLSFQRQDSFLTTKPVLDAFELPKNGNVAIEEVDLPEVHFASVGPEPVQVSSKEIELETVPQLPIQSTLPDEEVSIKEEQPKSVLEEAPPARIANLPEIPYIAPFGTPNLQNSVPATPPSTSQQKSWETGLY